MAKFDLTKTRQALKDQNLDGWLFYDFGGSDPIGRIILNLSVKDIQTRRWFYYIPLQGVPAKLVHSIERQVLDHLPGKKEVYLSWQEMEAKLKSFFGGDEKIAVQYSPNNALPLISRIDAGTFELLKTFKLRLLSSADLVQIFEARWTKAQLNFHRHVAGHLYEIIQKTFQMIKRKIKNHQEINELLVQKYMMRELKNRHLYFDRPPIVASANNSGNPHYFPSQTNNYPIYPGTILQLNIWAKENNQDAVYAIIAWVGYVGEKVPEEHVKMFDIIAKARNETITFVDNSMKKGQVIYGWQVDDVARGILNKAGYGSYFIHRTGHSIGRELFANGVNIDNLETRDERKVIPNTCFTIEPAVYFSEFGMRTEVNVFVDTQGAHVYTQPIQQQIEPILK